MKNLHIISLIAVFLATTVLPVHAEESLTPREKMQELRSEKIEAIKERFEKKEEERGERRELKASTSAGLRESILSRLLVVHTTRLEKRYAFVYGRLNHQIIQLQTKITTVKEKGGDVTAAQVKLNEAKEALEAAKVAGNSEVTAFKSMVVTSDTSIKDLAKEAKDTAISAKKLYDPTLKLIKESRELLRVAIVTSQQKE